MSDETKYVEEYLDKVLQVYIYHVFKNGGSVVAVDPVKNKVVFYIEESE